MTKGSIMGRVLIFAIPIIIGNILQYLYTTVDTLVIGAYCGHTSLAAVGTSSQPVEVLLCIFLGIGTGISILISQCTGAGDTEKIKRICETTVSFVYLCGIPIAILGWFYAPHMLRFMNVPADTFDAALMYTRIVLLAALGNIGYNVNAGILRGLGDSLASLLFLLVSCVVNIVLDILLVAVFGMDVTGVAVATSIAMLLAWVSSIVYIRARFPHLKFTFLPKKLDVAELKSMLAIGLPIGLNNSLYSFGHVAIQSMVNIQGSVFMAGNSVAGRITGLSNIAITGLSSAATAFSGQNFGAGNYSRLKEGHLVIPLSSGLITLAFGLFFISIRMPILRIFSKDETVLMYASRYVVVMLLSQWFYAIFNGIMCIVNGLGKVRYTTVINILMLWAVRIPAAWIITRYFDGTYIMLCFPISFSFGMLCMVAYYIFSPSWKEVMEKGGGHMGIRSRVAVQ
ncbi:MAG: MATE family efflux transporter [Lachnospiraceae bacterium]|nr:MATE family efflux transporter [Lachnospiraceae bacterium]